MTVHEFKSEIVQKGQLLPGIHGLRGFAALVLVFAEVTYRLIEVPGIRFGRKLIKRTDLHGSQTSQLRV